jgi:hypothetical protein
VDDQPTCDEIVAQHVRIVTEAFTQRELTPKQAKACIILARCLQGAGTYDTDKYISPFREYEGDTLAGNSNSPNGGGLWATGDLDGGTGGREFIYAYLPTRFVETLMEGTQDLPGGLDEILTTAATVYFTNTIKSALDEAIANVLYESATVITEMINSLTEPDFDQERFNKMVETIITEGNHRRRKRVREAMAEIDPKRRLKNLYHHYVSTEPAWSHASDIYKANKSRRPWKIADWKNAIKVEVQTEHGIDLDSDMISLLSDHPDDWLEPPPDNFEATPSALALEHAARLCGLPAFSRSTGHLRGLKCSQEKQAEEFVPQIG